MNRVIAVTSGKGGVGKTTVTANLALALAALGKRCVAVEGDVGLNNLDVALGAEEKIVYDAGEVALGKASVSEALVRIEEGLWLFPATTGASNLVTTEKFKEMVEELKRGFDFVLVDSPAGIEENFHRAVSAASEAVVVTTPHVSAVRDAYKTSKVLQSYGITEMNLIVNRVRGDKVADKATLSPEEIATVTGMPLVGVLPEDDEINVLGLADRKNKRSASAYSYALIADAFAGGERKIYDCVAAYGGVVARFKRWMGL